MQLGPPRCFKCSANEHAALVRSNGMIKPPRLPQPGWPLPPPPPPPSPPPPDRAWVARGAGSAAGASEQARRLANPPRQLRFTRSAPLHLPFLVVERKAGGNNERAPSERAPAAKYLSPRGGAEGLAEEAIGSWLEPHPARIPRAAALAGILFQFARSQSAQPAPTPTPTPAPRCFVLLNVAPVQLGPGAAWLC
ncbi:protein VASP homolog [Schistocerca americana]|uniref:protein VASP homolog n=1 Tax=Schistocerca americana TaxID=7009 RepID=UPI001F4FCF14|nr:protein VASP homolog [Schistocerca americana]